MLVQGRFIEYISNQVLSISGMWGVGVSTGGPTFCLKFTYKKMNEQGAPPPPTLKKDATCLPMTKDLS